VVAYNFQASGNILTIPFQLTCCEVGVIKCVHFLEGLPLKCGKAKTSTSARFLTIFNFDREYLQKGSTCRKSEKTVDQQQPLPCWAKKSWWTLVNKQKSYRRTCWPFLSAVLCKLMQFHSPRGSRVQFSGTFAMWSCCERNFNYLNCLSSRTCGAGRCWLVCCMLICSLSLLGPDISKAVGMEYEMAYGESNGHVIDEATWPWKIKGVTPIRLWIITVRLR